MIPLVCLDVDGTLVGPTGEVTEAVWAAAHAAVERGQHLALSTARGAFGSAWDMARRLDADGWHVFHAGAAVVQTCTGDVRSRAMTHDQIEAATHLARSNEWIIEYYTAMDYAVDDDHPDSIAHAALMGVPFERRSRAALDGDIVRVQFVVPDEDVAALAQQTPAGLTVSSATSPIMPGISFVTMTIEGVDKGTGITAIAAELGIPVSDVMMVGDSLNDLSALRTVGHPVAMGNAAPEIKEAALHHVASVTRDGVAEALELSSRL